MDNEDDEIRKQRDNFDQSPVMELHYDVDNPVEISCSVSHSSLDSLSVRSMSPVSSVDSPIEPVSKSWRQKLDDELNKLNSECGRTDILQMPIKRDEYQKFLPIKMQGYPIYERNRRSLINTKQSVSEGQSAEDDKEDNDRSSMVITLGSEVHKNQANTRELGNQQRYAHDSSKSNRIFLSNLQTPEREGKKGSRYKIILSEKPSTLNVPELKPEMKQQELQMKIEVVSADKYRSTSDYLRKTSLQKYDKFVQTDESFFQNEKPAVNGKQFNVPTQTDFQTEKNILPQTTGNERYVHKHVSKYAGLNQPKKGRKRVNPPTIAPVQPPNSVAYDDHLEKFHPEPYVPDHLYPSFSDYYSDTHFNEMDYYNDPLISHITDNYQLSHNPILHNANTFIPPYHDYDFDVNDFNAMQIDNFQYDRSRAPALPMNYIMKNFNTNNPMYL